MKIIVNNKNYDIGSKYYPVKNKSDIKFFTCQNTEKNENTELSDFVNSLNITPGFCYTNAELICKSVIGRKLSIEFYAGWIFVGDKEPLHHAWVVCDGNVIDVNVRNSSVEVLKTIDYSNSNWRSIAVEKIKAAEKRFKLSDDCVMGKVFDFLVYVGTRDKIDLAKIRYNTLINNFPDHLSYRDRNSQHSMTEFQKEIFRAKGII